MKLRDEFLFSFKHLKRRKLRTWLTLLSIVIGISSVVLLIGLSKGLEASVSEQLSKFGSDVIMVVPYTSRSLGSSPIGMASSSGKIYENEVSKLYLVSGVKDICSYLSNRASVSYKGNSKGIGVIGVEARKFFECIPSLELEEGRLFQDNERNSVVLGHKLANSVFDEKIPVGSYIYLDNKKYRVVGILSETGDSFAEIDSVAFISYPDARNLFSSSLAPREVSMIRILVSDNRSLNSIAEDIDWYLMNLHHVNEDEKDFTVITPEVINKKVNSILSIISFLLGSVAGVSLVIGSIGIANTMFMSVMDRKKEIGVLKALGATPLEITRLFFLESLLLSVFGSVLALVFSFLLSILLSFVGVKMIIDLETILMAVFISLIVGGLAGIFPSYRASKIPAVESLRYE